jgi:4-amino-4-deoxy-L-arabinose transferase-like glycosyltransferase
MILSNDPLGTWIFATFFFITALIIRLLVIILIPDLTLGSAVIAGAPYSDAQTWFSQALSLYNGHGMGGQRSALRPFFPILVAAVFSWTGPSYLVAVLINIILSSAAVTLVYLICERVFNRLVAIPTALAIACNPRIIFYSLVTLTETTGLFFSLVSLWFLISAAQRGRFVHSFLAGISFGLENLSRTISLLALPGFTFLLSSIQYQNRHNLKRAMVLGSVFVIGVGVVLSPWIVRQKLVHGILAISDNTASALYAASTPKWKIWNSGVYKEAEEKGIGHGIKEQYEYFNKEFIKNLREHSAFYLQNVCASFQVYLTKLCPKPFDENVLFPFTLVLSALLIFGTNITSLKNIVIMTIPILVWCILILFIPNDLKSLVVPVLFLLGLIYWPEKSQLLLINSVFFVGLGVSLFAMGEDNRVAVTVKWIPIAFFYAIFIKSSEFVVQKYGWPLHDGKYLDDGKQNAILWGHQETWLRKLKVVSTAGIIVLAVMTLLGFSKLLWSNFIASPMELTRLELSNTQRQEILSYLKSQLPSVVLADEKFLPLITHIAERGANQGRLYISEGRILDGILYRLKPRMHPLPGDRMLAQRDYFRTCFQMNGLKMIFPFDVPSDFRYRHLVTVGRLDVDTSKSSNWVVLEGLAIFPFDNIENKILFDQGLIARNADHLNLLQRLKDASLAQTPIITGVDSTD